MDLFECEECGNLEPEWFMTEVYEYGVWYDVCLDCEEA